MIFDKETDFEEAVIGILVERGWESEILRHPTEKDLIKNWADILFNNNRHKDSLNECPLTDGEMDQIMEQIIFLASFTLVTNPLACIAEPAIALVILLAALKSLLLLTSSTALPPSSLSSPSCIS